MGVIDSVDVTDNDSISSCDNSISDWNNESESECKNSETKVSSEVSILDKIKCWAFDYSINHCQLTGLLKLQTHDCFKKFPLDSRTIIKPLKFEVPTELLNPGEYVHFGLKTYI